jgi:hypothetical protein
VFLFVAYAMLVWYWALRFRRSWLGFACVVLGLVGVGLVGYAHWELNKWTNGRICLPVLQSLLYPYGVLVLIVGVFIASLPARYCGTQCRACGYDLTGLETEHRACPECSTRHAMSHEQGLPCFHCGGRLPTGNPIEAVCPICSTVHLMAGR